jgi:hypothetical protein
MRGRKPPHCDHKFVDSNQCLKCGWTPPAPEPTLEDLTLDPTNRRSHTERGKRMLAEALTDVGAARSIVIDEDNAVLAGEGVLDAAAAVGITKLQIVEADGRTIVAVRRRGLSPEQKRNLAIYDNRTAELSKWNPEQLAADAPTGALTPFFAPAELRMLLKTGTHKAATVAEVPTSEVQDRFWIAIEGPLPAQAQALERLRVVMKDLEGVSVELGTVPSEAWAPTK